MKKITFAFMLTFFSSLAAFIVLTATKGGFFSDKTMFLGIYPAIGYTTLLSFSFYIILRFKENAGRFKNLVEQKKKLEKMIELLKTNKGKGMVPESEYSKKMEDCKKLFEGINNALYARSSKIKGAIRKPSPELSDKMVFFLSNLFSTKKIVLGQTLDGETTIELKNIPREKINDIFKLVVILEPYKGLYQKEEVETALFEENYDKQTVTAVIEALYSG